MELRYWDLMNLDFKSTNSLCLKEYMDKGPPFFIFYFRKADFSDFI